MVAKSPSLMCLRNFCELCKECLRRRAFFEKSDNHRQLVKGLGPDFPVRAGQFLADASRFLFGHAQANSLAVSPPPRERLAEGL